MLTEELREVVVVQGVADCKSVLKHRGDFDVEDVGGAVVEAGAGVVDAKSTVPDKVGAVVDIDADTDTDNTPDELIVVRSVCGVLPSVVVVATAGLTSGPTISVELAIMEDVGH